MAEAAPKIRLFVEGALGPGAQVMLSPDQAHYLFNVMRATHGTEVAVFNGRDGEWTGPVTRTGRLGGSVTCRAPGRPQRRPPDLWLVFAPIKKARTDFIVEKAAELGAARVLPVFTRHTNAARVQPDRLRAHAIEAAEQCGETFVLDIAPPVRLEALLDAWDPGRRLVFCDESRAAVPAAAALAEAAPNSAPGPWAILIGPEGGFAPEEAARLRALPYVLPVTLGPRVLRADTAAVAAITLWQALLGDWR
ncbi:16S rRNA (uracil(1498)-N(3))-methyltransferase [Amaricoccus sp.]|uniref:16S rRNA (uracil(1498)-N(3))-methyltransferase n=1 Tax=Amaricoccus sp. TaxID=1872485 RepID=UPI0026122BC4|nr:16S rRNA (uracil(1498)-N(3))-methyltransferase [Amaricoccus sp.]HRO12622.1 16S rRNA (uracil(1498)-N(3))-methyltransferase [Amaricoccus sp.]